MNWFDSTFTVIMIFLTGGAVISFAKTLNNIYKPFGRLYKELENKLIK
ncbi:hypothetical protein V7158_01955 [Priestia megaterium]